MNNTNIICWLLFHRAGVENHTIHDLVKDIVLSQYTFRHYDQTKRKRILYTDENCSRYGVVLKDADLVDECHLVGIHPVHDLLTKITMGNDAYERYGSYIFSDVDLFYTSSLELPDKRSEISFSNYAPYTMNSSWEKSFVPNKCGLQLGWWNEHCKSFWDFHHYSQMNYPGSCFWTTNGQSDFLDKYFRAAQDISKASIDFKGFVNDEWVWSLAFYKLGLDPNDYIYANDFATIHRLKFGEHVCQGWDIDQFVRQNALDIGDCSEVLKTVYRKCFNKELPGGYILKRSKAKVVSHIVDDGDLSRYSDGLAFAHHIKHSTNNLLPASVHVSHGEFKSYSTERVGVASVDRPMFMSNPEEILCLSEILQQWGAKTILYVGLNSSLYPIILNKNFAVTLYCESFVGDRAELLCTLICHTDPSLVPETYICSEIPNDKTFDVLFMEGRKYFDYLRWYEMWKNRLSKTAYVAVSPIGNQSVQVAFERLAECGKATELHIIRSKRLSSTGHPEETAGIGYFQQVSL